MKTVLERARTIRGVIRVPGDKSIAHRALIVGALARGPHVIEGLPVSEDIQSTVSCLGRLGVAIEHTADGRTSVRPGPFASGEVLYAGNSGTTARLMAGLVAGQSVEVVMDGDHSLRNRPMERVAEPLRRMGAVITTTPGGRLPMTVRGGRLTGIVYKLPVPSAQVKSALLLAGVCAEGETVVEEGLPTRDHTERLLRAMGAPVRTENGRVAVEGPAALRGVEVKIPGDVSSAAFFIAAAACLPHSNILLPGVGMNSTRLGMLEALTQMGARVDRTNETSYLEEPVADVVVRWAPLKGTSIPRESIPTMIDELPVLAVVASQAEGETIVRGARELRFKESDRIRAMVENLSRLSAVAEELDDGFVIRGPCRLKGAEVSSFGDHRIAMAMAVAALVADGKTTIDGSEAAAVSYPRFFEDLQKLAG